MNATLKSLRTLVWTRRAGRSASADQMAAGSGDGHVAGQGSYGRGVYAGRSTAELDFSIQGSYGRGVYAGRSTAELDFSAQGSYASDR
jgi:hypothetical protein